MKHGNHGKFTDSTPISDKNDLKYDDYSRLFPEPHDFDPSEELLRELGSKQGPLVDRSAAKEGDAKVRSAGITFLGQFITHDISFDKKSSLSEKSDIEDLKNYRTPRLELDSLYGMGPQDPQSQAFYDENDSALLKLGSNDAGKPNDIPRTPDGTPIIGDERNDENVVLSQLHLAFIKFHNAVVKQLRDEGVDQERNVFDEAQRIVRWHFQWIVLHDFLPQIAKRSVIEKIMENGRRFYLPQSRLTIPVEFSAAALRFGHSIVKPHYIINDIAGGGIFHQMIDHKKDDSKYQQSGKAYHGILEQNAVQWKFFFWLDPSERTQLGRRIDTKIASNLFALPHHVLGDSHHEINSLPTLTLLRGKFLQLPSGENVASAMDLESAYSYKKDPALEGLDGSPLWYYILKEAEIQTGGERLGDVGSRIVAEVLIGLLQEDPESFLNQEPDWRPSLPSAIPGHFSIEDLLRFSGAATAKEDQANDPDTERAKKRLARYQKKYAHIQQKDPLVFGRWDILPYDSQIEAVHMALLPTGKVLYFSGFRVTEAINTETRTWNPVDGDIKKPTTYGDIFCSGHCHLEDGRVLCTGGTMEYRNLPNIPPWLVRLLKPITTPRLVRFLARFQGDTPMSFAGPTYLYIFDHEREEWDFVGDMKGGRWYPTNTRLPSGAMLLISGTDEAGGIANTNVYPDINRRIETYDPENGLQYLGDIPEFERHMHHHDHAGNQNPDGTPHGHDRGDGLRIIEGDDDSFPNVYPRMFVLPVPDAIKDKYPKGRAFSAGYGPDTKMLNLENWEWEDYGTLGEIRHDGCAVMLPLRPPNYDAQILVFGGSKHSALEAEAKKSAQLIDFGAETDSETKAQWEDVKPAFNGRVNGAAVLLPNGKVFACSGNETGRFLSPNHKCELFDPVEHEWTLAAEQMIPRGYHCTAVLLQDGRVLASGTTPFGNHELGMEVYYPEYSFKGSRPVIVELQDQIHYESEFDIQYEFSWEIERAVLISPGSMTHAFDMGQRFIELEFEKTSKSYNALKAIAPPDEHVAPPGYYMLFLLSEHGVPSSVGQFIRLSQS